MHSGTTGEKNNFLEKHSPNISKSFCRRQALRKGSRYLTVVEEELREEESEKSLAVVTGTEIMGAGEGGWACH